VRNIIKHFQEHKIVYSIWYIVYGEEEERIVNREEEGSQRPI
jgi:hypothetical protein